MPGPAKATTLDTDTIAAVATAAGVGGIGVVRISGPLALEIGQAITGRALEPRRATYSEFRDREGRPLDAGIALAFTAPRSFTGENVVELQGHGGPVVLAMLLQAVLERGARRARPGEFTERAFLNGKLDLAQAEAVADLIGSASEAAARGAMRSLEGEFSRAIEALDRAVLEVRVFVEAAMDFPEEDQDFLAEGLVAERLADLSGGFEALIAQARQGVLLRDGITVALVGAPNVGKSSLLNRLSGTERAIVTEIPGTTRDLVEADLSIEGLPIRLVDTAGLRSSLDPVEQEGMRRTRAQAERADLVLALEEDATGAAEPGPARELIEAGLPAARLIRVRNKVDLSGGQPGVAPSRDGIVTVRVSALTGAGVEELVAAIKSKAGFAGEGTTFTARRRHIEALHSALAALERGRELVAEAAPAELAAEELRAVHHALGSIVGQVSADELLGEIFSSFCIGK